MESLTSTGCKNTQKEGIMKNLELRCSVPRLKEALKLEKTLKLEEHQKLSGHIRRMTEQAERYGEVLIVYDDFAKHSFGFTVSLPDGKRVYNGGIICHNLPNNNTFTVTLCTDSHVYWSVHT